MAVATSRAPSAPISQISLAAVWWSKSVVAASTAYDMAAESVMVTGSPTATCRASCKAAVSKSECGASSIRRGGGGT
eukprot:1802554-Prymnesium_polylepis.1